ncbi:MAG TPA: hypothetical protein VGW37_11900 [Terriglobia bacterium]|nr:hypothetical protein [Terriglobia bacterium]
MKRRTQIVLVGALLVGAAAVSSMKRGAQRSTCTGGPCCLPLPGLADFSTNVWTPVPPTNQTPAERPAQPFTNGTQ